MIDVAVPYMQRIACLASLGPVTSRSNHSSQTFFSHSSISPRGAASCLTGFQSAYIHKFAFHVIPFGDDWGNPNIISLNHRGLFFGSKPYEQQASLGFDIFRTKSET
jgi:hypothetical protein